MRALNSTGRHIGATAAARLRGLRRTLGLALIVTCAMGAAAVPAAWGASQPGAVHFSTPYVDNTNSTVSSERKLADWMSWVPDTAKLGEMSIPGTHDSAALHGGPVTQTQVLCGDGKAGPSKNGCNLKAQLDAGVRFLDIRVSCYKNGSLQYLEDFHGSVDQDLSFDQTLRQLHSWLDSHRTETVLMHVQNNQYSKAGHKCDKSGKSVFQRLNDDYFNDTVYKSWFWHPDSDAVRPGLSPAARATDGWKAPQLGAVRNKIVLVTGFAATLQTIAQTQKGKILGAYESGDHYNVCTTAGCRTPGAKANDGKTDDTIDTGQKIAEIAKDLSANCGPCSAANPPIQGTFASAASYVFPYYYALGRNVVGDTTYQGFNEAAAQDLWRTKADGGSASSGVLGSDFPGRSLIASTVVHNFGVTGTAPLSTAAGDFTKLVSALQPVAVDLAGDRGLLGVNEHWDDLLSTTAPTRSYTLISLLKGDDTTADDTSSTRLSATTTSGGYRTTVIDMTGVVPTVRQRELQVVGLRSAPGTKATPAAAAKAILAALEKSYPAQTFIVAASKKGQQAVKAFKPGFQATGKYAGGTYTIIATGAKPNLPVTITPSTTKPLPGDSIRYAVSVAQAVSKATAKLSLDGAAAPACSSPGTIAGATTTFTCTAPWTAQDFGAHTVTVVVDGAPDNGALPATGSIKLATNGGTPVVNPVSTALSCTSPVADGTDSSCTVTVADAGSVIPATPTGSVTFTADHAATLGSSTCILAPAPKANTADCSVAVTAQTPGAATAVHAASDGDSRHSPGNANATFDVTQNPTKTSVTCSPNPGVRDSAITCAATVSDTNQRGFVVPSGTVHFDEGHECTLKPAADPRIAGCSASLVPAASAPGTATLHAAYGGDTEHTSSAGTTPEVLRDPVTVLLGCASTAERGTPVSCTVTATDVASTGATAPNGSVAVGSGAGCRLAAMSATASRCVATPVPAVTGPGPFRIDATYPGNDTYTPGEAAGVMVQIKDATTTAIACAPAAIAPGSTTTCTATVSDTESSGKVTPTGSVAFTSSGAGTRLPGSCPLVATGTPGVSSCSTAFKPVSDPETLTATYAGSTLHLAAAKSVIVGSKNPTTTAVACAAQPSTLALPPQTCTVTVKDAGTSNISTPTGTVSLTATPDGSVDHSTCTLAATSTGSATCSVVYSAASFGTDTITGSYPGDPLHSLSQGSATIDYPAPPVF